MRYLITVLMVAASCAMVSRAAAHGVPIMVTADANKNILTDASVYESDFNLVGGTLILATLPGIEIPTPGSGFPAGTDLNIVAKHKLLYFNGTDVVSSSSTLEVENVDGDTLDVTNATGVSAPLFWGHYSGAAGWHQHSDYLLSPVPSPAGLYGLVFCIEADGYTPSDPILIAFNYGLSHSAAHEGIEAFERILNPVPEPSSVVLLATGALGLAFAVRRKLRR
ncbi:MAG: PEP-CTERM sorting domain-containing protein [Pirellulales bacterium]|nr:PEP-CTERM sorting domain-containing protein [Pirellulales bacterium]